MKILASGDLHGDVSFIEYLAEKAEKENVDVVILAGDLTTAGREVPRLIKPFKEKNKKVLIIPGNHESVAAADFLAEIYEIKNLHGQSVRYGKIGFFGAGGAPIGYHIIDDCELFSKLEQGFVNIDYLDKKIMVTHIHPKDSLMDKMSEWVEGSSAINKAIYTFNPDILICAHVHEASGIEEKIGNTRVINVSKTPKIIEIN